MWRAEEMGVDKLVGIVHIHGVGYRPVLEGTKMMEGVVAYLMSVGNGYARTVGNDVVIALCVGGATRNPLLTLYNQNILAD